MIKGVGTDIIEIDRIRDAVERSGQPFLNKIFTETEQSYCSRFNDPYPHYAARFAAKEAVVKALGTGLRNGLEWTDIEIRSDELGKPSAHVNGETLQVSLSHCRTHATAVAIYE